MYHYVYRITNKVENKHYYGSRSCKITPSKDLGVKYFSSSKNKYFIRAQKENPKNFKYKIIRITSSRKMSLELEVTLHAKFQVAKNPKFYNLACQTNSKFSTSGVPMKDKRSYNFTEEHKSKISKALKGNTNHLGHIHTIEAKKKVSAANKGNKYNQGKKHSEETKIKIGKASIGRNIGHSYINAKPINVYCYKTDKLIASNVTLVQWAKSNNCSPSALSRTLKADRSIPSSSKNPHHHKQYYIKHIKENFYEAHTKRQ